MVPLSPALLVAGANACVGARDLPPNAAFVHHVGYWSHWNPSTSQSSWPFSPETGCDEIAQLAAAAGVLTTSPRAGDLFLRWCARRRSFVNTGIVVTEPSVSRLPQARHVHFLAVEGASSSCGGAEDGVVLLAKTLSGEAGDRFVHWPALEGRQLGARLRRAA